MQRKRNQTLSRENLGIPKANIRNRTIDALSLDHTQIRDVDHLVLPSTYLPWILFDETSGQEDVPKPQLVHTHACQQCTCE